MSIIVSQAEANLLTVARVAVGIVPPVDALRLLVTSVSAPRQLGPTARSALADTLSRGIVLALAREGGWVSDGSTRLWERHPAPPLVFTGNVVRLLSWLLTTPLAETEASPLVFEGSVTLAEDCLIALLLERLKGTGCRALLARQQAIRSLPLTALVNVAALAQELPMETVPVMEPSTLAPFVEGLRSLLARSWRLAELGKGELPADVLLRVGRAQTELVDAWLTAIDAVGRHELGAFLIDTAEALFKANHGAHEMTRNLASSLSLRERSEVRRRSGAVFRAVVRMREWDQRHRSVHFIDDEYGWAQRLVVDWARLGEPGFSWAAAQVAELEALPT